MASPATGYEFARRRPLSPLLERAGGEVLDACCVAPRDPRVAVGMELFGGEFHEEGAEALRPGHTTVTRYKCVNNRGANPKP